MNYGFDQATTPRGNKKNKLNPYEIYLLQQNKTNHKQMASLLQKDLDKIKRKNQLVQQLQNVSFESKSNRHSIKPVQHQQYNPEEEERIGRVSISVRETMVELEQQHQKPSHLDINIKAIVTLQRIVRKRIYKRKTEKQTKQNRYRLFVLKELFTTEQTYNKALQILVNQYMIPLGSIIKDKESKLLFANVKAIYSLSQQILNIFDQLLQNYVIQNISANEELLQVVSFFRIYSEYLINYNNAFKLQIKLKKENVQFKTFCEQIDKTNQGKSLENYYLIQPVQRIPKYILLFKDLIKNTDQEHIDYKILQNVLQQFEKVANDNNKSMEILVKNAKIFELQKQYGQIIKIVEVNREFLREESLHMYFTQDREIRPIIAYFLSDLILITERDQNNYILKTYLKINYLSSCLILPEMHNYQHSFQINGVENSITLVVKSDNSEKDLNEYVQLVNTMIKKLEQKKQDRDKVLNNNQLQESQQWSITLSIQGTQEQLDASGKVFTQYVFEVDIKNIIQKVFLRFSLFKKIYEEAKIKFQKCKFPQLNDSVWQDGREAAIVDQRKIVMAEFLQVLLNSKEFQSDISNQKTILTLIGLPENFYELPNLLSQKQKQSLLQTQFSFRSSKKPQSLHIESIDNLKKVRHFENATMTTTLLTGVTTPRGPVKPMVDLVKQLQNTTQKESEQNNQIKIEDDDSNKKSQFKGLRATSLANSRKISATQLITAESRGNSRQGSIVSEQTIISVKIKVQIFLTFKTIEKEYLINKDSSSFQLLEEIASDLKLQSAFDFRLYQIDGHYQKPLDHDEKLWNLLIKIDDSKGIFKKAQKIPIYNEKKLQLRKYLYLSEEEEKEFYKSDLIRLELITYQLFDDISTFKLIVQPKDHVMYTALYLYLIGYKNLDQQNIPQAEIKQFVPSVAYKTIPQEYWNNFLPTLISNFEKQIRTLQEEEIPKKEEQQHNNNNNNNNQLTQSDISDNQKSEKHFAMQVFLDLIKSTRFYGVTNYPVKPEKESLNYLYELSKIYWVNKKKLYKQFENYQQEDCRVWNSLYLSVSHKSLIILYQLKSQVEFLEIDYAEISSISSLQNSLAIYIDYIPLNNIGMQINKKICLKFETEKSFQIKQLIDEYVKLQIEAQETDNLFCDEVLNN